MLVSLIGNPFGGDTRDLGFELRSPEWEENWIAKGPMTRIYDLLNCFVNWLLLINKNDLASLCSSDMITCCGGFVFMVYELVSLDYLIYSNTKTYMLRALFYCSIFRA